ncbi:MAG: SDR family oxidoreductase [Burkholderiales bacterium]|jgi:NAD(P)-dependent dehydrogenase (short-subunit alcohol dehydrogenase family)|nr:SDR family oxidoreductase [Nitrosomonadaceae bacterium]
MQSVLIIGASRGLGLEFVRQYRQDSWLTLGTCRSPEQDALLAAEGATALRLDVNEAESFASLARALDGRSLDLCIYNAGVFGPEGAHVRTAPDRESFDAVMHANVFGALQAIPVVAPALAKSKGKFAFVTSRMGSIEHIASGNAPMYRASKAALNAVVKCAANEYGPHGVTCFVMHPGWVKTDMGGANADLEPSVSISGMRKVIASADASANGKFFNYDGALLPW